MEIKYSEKLKYLLILLGIVSVTTRINCQENVKKTEYLGNIQSKYTLNEKYVIKQFVKSLDSKKKK